MVDMIREGTTAVGRMMFSQIRFSLGLIVVAFGSIQYALAQGVATGGSAVPARPLRAGMKPPTVDYHDIADQAGLTGINISGSETSKQYIVEATGNGVAIFDFDNDGLP